jgi:hypothetical protein
MSVKSDPPLFWLAVVVGGLFLALSHSASKSMLGDWIAAFGITGSLCTILTEKIGTYRPWQDPERVPRPPLGPLQPPQ